MLIQLAGMDPSNPRIPPGLRTLGLWRIDLHSVSHTQPNFLLLAAVGYSTWSVCHAIYRLSDISIPGIDWAPEQLLFESSSVFWSHMGGFYGTRSQIRPQNCLFVKMRPHSMKRCFSNHALWTSNVQSYTNTYLWDCSLAIKNENW